MMGQNLKWRFFIIISVLLFAIITILPNFVKLDEKSWIFSTQKINYGLDIQGGLHMVMGVDIEDVIETQAQRLGSTLQEELKNIEVNINEYSVSKEGSQIWLNLVFDSIQSIEGANDYLEKEYGTTLQIINTIGNKLTLRYLDTYLKQLREDTLNQAIETIRNRIDEFGVSEPSITAQGGERILIQLPGLKEAEKAKALINKTAQLQFMMVSDEKTEISNWIREAEEAGGYSAGSLKYSDYIKRINSDLKDKLPKETIIRFGKAENVEDIQLAKIPYLLETSTNLGGESLKDAFVSMGEFNEPVVTVYFNPQGGKKFADLTAENVGRSMAIVLDDVVYSAPRINERIPGGQATITMGGGRDYEAIMEESRMISMALRAGALPAKLEQLEERTVGPSLGADSIEKGKQAGILGAILVLAFMLFWYKSFGLIANLALLFNVGLVLAILTSLEATLTLPGIAGIALTIGMAVDANVIVFERIKEELRRGTSLAGSIREGYAKAFSAIFDANLTTAATSIILMYYGTGPVRGFAVTLLIGIVTSMFTALFVTHTVLDLLVGKFKKNKFSFKVERGKMKTKKEFDIGKIDFIGKTSLFSWVSGILMIGAVSLIFTKGFNYGIDFSGGTEVQVQFKNNIGNIGEIRNFLTNMEMGSFQVQKFGEENEYLIRFETLLGETDQETNQLLQERISKVTEGLNTEFSQNEPVIRKVDSVGPQIGEQLKRNGLLAVFYSLLLIMIYIGLRFDYNFAPGAVVCLFHDSLITLGIFVLLGKEINVQILAAILTIIGYSLNDTIIVFDRIRENLLKHKKGSLSQIINISVNEILSRTLVTSFTTLLAIGSLYFLAGGVIIDFAFAMGIGVLIGTYSSIYVASPLVIYFERFKSKQRATA